jgi:hypothetical protein
MVRIFISFWFSYTDAFPLYFGVYTEHLAYRALAFLTYAMHRISLHLNKQNRAIIFSGNFRKENVSDYDHQQTLVSPLSDYYRQQS